MGNKIALVTNVLDFVGPPAVKALLQSGYDVVAHDPAFQDANQRDVYKINNPGAIPLSEAETDYIIHNNDPLIILHFKQAIT